MVSSMLLQDLREKGVRKSLSIVPEPDVLEVVEAALEGTNVLSKRTLVVAQSDRMIKSFLFKDSVFWVAHRYGAMSADIEKARQAGQVIVCSWHQAFAIAVRLSLPLRCSNDLHVEPAPTEMAGLDHLIVTELPSTSQFHAIVSTLGLLAIDSVLDIFISRSVLYKSGLAQMPKKDGGESDDSDTEELGSFLRDVLELVFGSEIPYAEIHALVMTT